MSRRPPLHVGERDAIAEDVDGQRQDEVEMNAGRLV